MNARRFRNARRAGSIAAFGLALALAGNHAWSKKAPPAPDPDDPVEEAADVGPPVPAETDAGKLRTYKDKANHRHKLTLGTVEPARIETRPQQVVMQLRSEKEKKEKKDKEDKQKKDKAG